MPRKARDDYIARLEAKDGVVQREPMRGLMLGFQEVLDDLRAFINLRFPTWSWQEVQLGWYPSCSQGYARHYDAEPSVFGRVITAIA